MNDLQLIERLAVTDAYGPETPLPDDLRRDVVLLEIERRKSMDTLERTETGRPPGNRRSRWSGALVVAVAAAVIIVVGVTAVWLTSRATDEPAVSTTTSTTIASAGGASANPSPDEFTFVSAMGVVLSEGDASRILATIDDGTEFLVGTDQPIRSTEDLEDFLTYGIALGSTWARGVCTMGSGGVATCELIRWSEDFDPYAGVDVQVMLVHLSLDGDRATTFGIEFTSYGSDNWLTRELEFMAWLDATYPDDYAELYTRPAADDVWAPDWSDPAAAAALIEQRVPEYLAATG